MNLKEFVGEIVLTALLKSGFANYYRVRDEAIREYYGKLLRDGKEGKAARQIILEEFEDHEGRKLNIDDKGLQKILYAKKKIKKSNRSKTSQLQP